MAWAKRYLKALAIGLGCAFAWAILDHLTLSLFGWSMEHSFSTVVGAAMVGALWAMPN